MGKVILAVGFLIKEAERRGLSLTQYDIVKSVFLADRSHLNRFGRPITFDNYVAMKHGPVPSLVYDLLKANRAVLSQHGVASLPWRRKAAEHVGRGCFHFTDARTGNEEDVFSPSEMEALRDALSVISGLTFGQVRELTHNDVAYKEAWRSVDENSSYPMSLGLLFDTPDFGAADVVEFLSKQMASNKSDSDVPDTVISTRGAEPRRHS